MCKSDSDYLAATGVGGDPKHIFHQEGDAAVDDLFLSLFTPTVEIVVVVVGRIVGLAVLVVVSVGSDDSGV